MKNLAKKLCILLWLVSLCAALVSCGADYVDSVPAYDLAMSASSSFVTDGGTKVLDEDVILEFDEDGIVDGLIDFTVIKANNAKNINEIGIFRAEKADRADIEEMVKKYVDNLVRTYRSMNYFPEEVEKIDCATVKVFGNYVVYSFLNEVDTEAFHNALEAQIKK